MPLRMRNSWKYKGDDRWDWKVFLDDGNGGDLGTVESVEYILHPTFKNPVRTVRAPSDNFSLKSNGWGSFQIKAFVNLVGGERIRLIHDLELYYEPDEGISD